MGSDHAELVFCGIRTLGTLFHSVLKFSNEFEIRSPKSDTRRKRLSHAQSAADAGSFAGGQGDAREMLTNSERRAQRKAPGVRCFRSVEM